METNKYSGDMCRPQRSTLHTFYLFPDTCSGLGGLQRGQREKGALFRRPSSTNIAGIAGIMTPPPPPRIVCPESAEFYGRRGTSEWLERQPRPHATPFPWRLDGEFHVGSLCRGDRNTTSRSVDCTVPSCPGATVCRIHDKRRPRRRPVCDRGAATVVWWGVDRPSCFTHESAVHLYLGARRRRKPSFTHPATKPVATQFATVCITSRAASTNTARWVCNTVLHVSSSWHCHVERVATGETTWTATRRTRNSRRKHRMNIPSRERDAGPFSGPKTRRKAPRT